MDIRDVLKLVDAGFTADQIAALMQATIEEASKKEPTPQPEPAPAPEPAPEPTPSPDPDLFLSNKIEEFLGKKFDELQSNLRFPASPTIDPPKPVTIDDVISRFFKED